MTRAEYVGSRVARASGEWVLGVSARARRLARSRDARVSAMLQLHRKYSTLLTRIFYHIDVTQYLDTLGNSGVGHCEVLMCPKAAFDKLRCMPPAYESAGGTHCNVTAVTVVTVVTSVRIRWGALLEARGTLPHGARALLIIYT